jgi:hypothetical protein
MLYIFFHPQPPSEPEYAYILGRDAVLHVYDARGLTREEFIAQLPERLLSGRICFSNTGEVTFQKFNIRLDVLRAGLEAIQRDPQRPVGAKTQASMMLTSLEDLTQNVLEHKAAEIQRRGLAAA